MEKESPLVHAEYLLQKFPGKGGWTYAAIPEVLQDKKSPFGWVKVKGRIDQHPFENLRLMPMGNGKLFFPVKASIRKIIKKEAGDTVELLIYADNAALKIPDEVLACLEEEPKALEKFMNLNEGEQKNWLQWIGASKNEDIKVDRIANMINHVLKNKKFNLQNL